MKTDATSVDGYLDSLPAARHASVALTCERLRATPEVSEAFEHGMPFFTLEGEPFIAVASQKRYVSLYIAGLDETLPAHPDLADDLEGINRGKNCLRFRDTQLDRVTSELVDRLIEVTSRWRAARAADR